MKGSIHADVRTGCACGGSFTSRKDIGNYHVPVCSKCEKLPPKLRIRRTLPGIGDRTIRYYNGRRLESIHDAIYCLKRLDEQISTGNFKFLEYISQGDYEDFRFGRFSEEYLKNCQIEVDAGKRSPMGLKKDASVIKIHLMPFFKNHLLGDIRRGSLEMFDSQFKGTRSNRRSALLLLKTILRYALRKELIQAVPAFPVMGAAPHRKNDFIERPTQIEILNAIENPLKRSAIELLCIFCFRPCEIRALKWGDIDFEEKTIHIKRHFSGIHLMAGRKSQGQLDQFGELKLPFFSIDGLRDPLEIFFSIGVGHKDEFVFKTKTGKPLGPNDLYKVWVAAQKKLNFEEIVDLYEGTKHASASAFLRSGVPIDTVREILGHTNIGTTERYAKHDVKSIKRCVQRALDTERKGEVLEFKRE